MKKTLIALTLVLAFALTASAQMPSKPFSIYVGGGIGLPQKPDLLKDYWSTGYHFMGGVGLKMGSVPGLEFVAKGQYNYFPSDKVNGVDIDGANFTTLMFGVDGRFRLSTPAAPLAPFASAGIGFANMKFSDNNNAGTTGIMTPTESTTKFYFNIAAGAEFKAGASMHLFAQAAYVSIANSGQAYGFVPITVGLKF